MSTEIIIRALARADYLRTQDRAPAQSGLDALDRWYTEAESCQDSAVMGAIDADIEAAARIYEEAYSAAVLDARVEKIVSTNSKE